MTPEEKKERKRLYQIEYRKKNKEALREKKREYDKKYNEKNRDKKLAQSKDYRKRNPDTIKKWRLNNVDRIKKCSHEYYDKHSEHIKEKSKEWRLANVESVKSYNKKWNNDNPNYKKNYYLENKEQLLTNQKVRLLNDPVFKLSRNIRKRIWEGFTENGYSKESRTYKILGCTFEHLKEHIESQWEDWMDWDNYGEYNGELNYGWDVDHIIPISSVLTEEDVISLNHYTNLQPLCSKTNRDIKKAN